ncbi:MAG: DUF4172 domain-containing protein [Candidatus Methylacidiphilaceae bacterium]
MSVARRAQAMAVVEEVVRNSEIEGERLHRATIRSSMSRRLGLDSPPRFDRRTKSVAGKYGPDPLR